MGFICFLAFPSMGFIKRTQQKTKNKPYLSAR